MIKRMVGIGNRGEILSSLYTELIECGAIEYNLVFIVKVDMSEALSIMSKRG